MLGVIAVVCSIDTPEFGEFGIRPISAYFMPVLILVSSGFGMGAQGQLRTNRFRN